MKSGNISYRYDVEKMALVFKNEKIDNPRKALDFLLDKYWWEKKAPIQYTPVTPAAYDGERLPKGYVADEPLSFDKLKAEIQPQDKAEVFAAQLHNAPDLGSLEAVGRRIKNSGLLWKEKQNLQLLGQQIAKAKFID